MSYGEGQPLFTKRAVSQPNRLFTCEVTNQIKKGVLKKQHARIVVEKWKNMAKGHIWVSQNLICILQFFLFAYVLENMQMDSEKYV